jgi:L-methionine (R)-S-oxide reductase
LTLIAVKPAALLAHRPHRTIFRRGRPRPPLLHSHSQLSTRKQAKTSCQVQTELLSSRQVEPGSLKNFAAQSKEGAIAERLMRPQFFSAAASILQWAGMLALPEKLLADLHSLVSAAASRTASLQSVADLLRTTGSYRWVGLYDVDHSAAIVSNIVWSGPGPPEHPTFPITKGLTGAAISAHKTINIGDVAADPRYLTAFGTTRSEIIVPVFHMDGSVVGTIDIESEHRNAFSSDVQAFLESCSDVIRPLWRR